LLVKDRDVYSVIAGIDKTVRSWGVPYVSKLARRKRDPFRTLISCIISLRTKDEVTSSASGRLFRLATSPRGMAKIGVRRIERAIYPAGFYRNKARQIAEISRRIVRVYGGHVPDTIEELLTFKGVGRKTANLVVSLGFGRPAICVDTHVHRIMNRLGYVSTRTPEQTESSLREKLPIRYWIGINTLLVLYGQRVCTPVSPWCSRCEVKRWCGKVGVDRSR
jgi:endonuclease-3